jgi:hypothetical protein
MATNKTKLLLDVDSDTAAAADALFGWLQSQGINPNKSVLVLSQALARLLVSSGISEKSARYLLDTLTEYTVMNIKLKRKHKDD